MFKKLKVGRGGLVGILLLVLLFSFAGAAQAIEERTYTRLSGGTTPVAGDIQFTAYYKGNDNLIQTEDSWSPTLNDGWYSALGVTRAESAQIPGLVSTDTYNVWINSLSANEAGTASGTVGLVSPNYTTPGTSANKLILAASNYLAIPTGTGAVPGNGRAFVVWTQVAGATGYTIYRRPTPGNPNVVYTRAGTSTENWFMDSGLTNGTSYYYIIIATASGKRSGHTDEIPAVPNATAPSIASITPTSGPAGTTDVVIAGTGFGADPGAASRGTLTDNVRFNGNILPAANVTAWSDTSITITVPSYANGTYNVTVTNDSRISNNDRTFTIGSLPAGTLQFSAATYSVAENVAGGTVTITVTRTGGSSGAVEVRYDTSNVSATAGSDYTAITGGTLSWAAGDAANKTFTVTIINDSIYEGSEDFRVALRDPTNGATLGSPNTATVTITDDDPPPPAGSLQFSAATYSVVENVPTATITVTRTGGSSGVVGVTYAIGGGTSTATAGSDYTATTPGTLSWAAGDAANKTFTVTIINDSTFEPDETVNLALSAPTGGAVLGSPNSAILTITNDDVSAPPTSVVIDDIEGLAVIPLTGYYAFNGTGTPAPVTTRVTGAANLHEGTYGMNTVYAAGAASPNDWRGWGGVLTSTQNLSATNTISFWMKGDGSANKVKIQFKDADGSNYGIADADAVALSDTTWKEYKIPVSRLTYQVPGAPGTIPGFDPTKIIEYQFVFSGTAASTGILIDYVVATTEAAPPPSTDPRIDSITPATGAVGATITITGANLDTAGVVQFITEGGVITSVNSAATNTPITAWSPTGDSITMRIPSLTAGSKTVKVVRASDSRESNGVTFEVTAAAAPADSATNAYPNPFNPLGGETTKIVFSPGSAAKADIYIFDMTAKLVSKLNWPTTGTTRPDGRVEVTWDGKNSYGEIVGDGVYLYRVVDGGVRKGKILVVNKK